MAAAVASRGDPPEAELLGLLACPACNLPGQLLAQARSLECAQCGTSFPVLVSGGTTIPWAFPDPASTMLEWQARFRGFLHVNQMEQARLRAALADNTLPKRLRRRIEGLLEARESQRAQIIELLEPLGFDPAAAASEDPNPVDRLSSKVPKNQGLLSYHDNVFRDWSWNNGENEIQLRALESTLR